MSDQTGNPYGSDPGEGKEPNSNPYGQPPGQPYGQPSYGEPPAYGQQPQDPYGPPPTHSEPGQNPYGAAPGYPQQFAQPNYGQQQKQPQATTAMILGILGLVCCSFLAPVAWIMGQKAVREIDASGGALAGRGEAKAGQILGIVGTVVFVLAILWIVVSVVIAVNSGSTTSIDNY